MARADERKENQTTLGTPRGISWVKIDSLPTGVGGIILTGVGGDCWIWFDSVGSTVRAALAEPTTYASDGASLGTPT